MAAVRSNSILVVSLVFATIVGVAPLQSAWLTNRANLALLQLASLDGGQALGSVAQQTPRIVSPAQASDARTLFARATEATNQPATHYGLGLVLLMTDSSPAAVVQLQAASAARPGLAGFFGGVAALREGGAAAAGRTWAGSSTVPLARTRAHALIADGRAGDAIPALTAIATADPESTQVWLDLGEARINLQHWDAASAAYEQVLKLDPSDSAASYMLAYISFYGRHDIETTQARLQQLVAAPLQPQQAYNVYVLSGRLALARGNSDAALAWFQRAVELPSIAPRFALNEMASMYEGLGEYDQAIVALRDAARDAPTDPVTAARLGDVYVDLNDLPSALSAYRQAVTLSPATLSYRVSVADVLQRLGHDAEARTAWAVVLAIDPGHERAQRELGVASPGRTAP